MGVLGRGGRGKQGTDSEQGTGERGMARSAAQTGRGGALAARSRVEGTGGARVGCGTSLEQPLKTMDVNYAAFSLTGNSVCTARQARTGSGNFSEFIHCNATETCLHRTMKQLHVEIKI